MVSAAEQLVANLNFAAFAKADELKKRILFTLGALIIYRLGTYIPIPGINPEALAETFRQQMLERFLTQRPNAPREDLAYLMERLDHDPLPAKAQISAAA